MLSMAGTTKQGPPHLKLIIVSTNHFLLPNECARVNSLQMLPAGETGRDARLKKIKKFSSLLMIS